METKGGFYISQIKQLQDRIFGRLLAEAGLEINGSQGRILFVLWKEEGLTMSEIGKRTSLANNTLTSIIDRMASREILIRKQDAKNRRQVRIYLTDTARNMKKKYEEVSQKMNRLFYRGFEEEEVGELEINLKRILENLKDYERDVEKTAIEVSRQKTLKKRGE
ncbi:MAG: MarR family transcriptional regulator [Clostridiales bacterium]|nr:MarR family transcriptional regulator [Clostridiales bacterium]MDU3241750.1 MarR family transcriptional regulator [Clostridiales bacterium]